MIKAELSAKSTEQPSKVVLDYISKLPFYYTALDYGCGKLRYSIPLAKQVRRVVAIDSDIQITKKQKISGNYIAPKNYYNFMNLTVKSVECDEWRNINYDVVFCTNVLSAIPNDCDRMKVIFDSRSVLENNGHLFIVNQYRNSYFSQYKLRDDTMPYNDGWLIERGENKYSFYGMIALDKVISMCKTAGFCSFKISRGDGSYYVQAYLQ